MKIIFDESIRMKAPEFMAGYSIIENVKVEKSQKPLKKEIMTIINSVRKKYETRKQMYSSLPITAVRDLFKKNGRDPSKYAPSAEALLKRIIDGKDLYRINNVVECNNIGSMKYELPMGVYDLDKIKGDVIFKVGSEKDFMKTMAKGEMKMNNLLLTRDDEKLFGSPVSDSLHARITETTRNVLLLVYSTKRVGEKYLLEAIKYTANNMSKHASGKIIELNTVF